MSEGGRNPISGKKRASTKFLKRHILASDNHGFIGRVASNLGVVGQDRYGRTIDADRSFKEGLVGLQRDFNRSTRLLLKQLDPLYDLLWYEFEDHFGPLIAAATHGFNAKARHKKES